MTEEGRKIQDMLYTPMFICAELESWLGDDNIEEFMNDEVPCSLCYEEEMGEDL